jgi:hypothetical protein
LEEFDEMAVFPSEDCECLFIGAADVGVHFLLSNEMKTPAADDLPTVALQPLFDDAF